MTLSVFYASLKWGYSIWSIIMWDWKLYIVIPKCRGHTVVSVILLNILQIYECVIDDRCSTCQQTSHSTAMQIIKSSHNIKVWKKSRLLNWMIRSKVISRCFLPHRVTKTWNLFSATQDSMWTIRCFEWMLFGWMSRAQQHWTNKEMCVFSVLNFNEAEMRTDWRRGGGKVKLIFG